MNASKKQIFKSIEELYGKYDQGFIEKVIDDMKELGEIYAIQESLISTSLSADELEKKMTITCNECGRGIFLLGMIKGWTTIKPKQITYEWNYVCPINSKHILCDECFHEMELSDEELLRGIPILTLTEIRCLDQLYPVCPKCNVSMVPIDYIKEVDLVRELFPF